MELAQTLITLEHRGKMARVEGMRVRFSAHQCFARDGGADDRRCLQILADHLASLPGLAVCVADGGRFLRYFLELVPSLRFAIQYVIVETIPHDGRTEPDGLPVRLAA